MPSTDVLKENKGQKTHLNKHITTNSMSSIFSKKELGASSSGSIRKKGKVLCDVVTTSSTAMPSTSASVKLSDLSLIPVVPPTKRPKVGTTKKLLSNDSTLSSSAAAGAKDGSANRFATDTINRSVSHLTADIPVCRDVIDIIDNDLDNNKPCCSSSIGRSHVSSTTIFQKTVGKKSNNLTTSSSSTSSSTTTVAPIFHTKKSSTKVRLKFSGIGGNTLLKQLKRGGGSLHKDAIKLKKKKILKSDVNIKRKKSKVF